MSKLHFGWNQLSTEYYRLWNRTFEADADAQLFDLAEREHELSELATTDAPYDEKSLLRWEEQVFRQHRLTAA